jgi:hypothetical protein
MPIRRRPGETIFSFSYVDKEPSKIYLLDDFPIGLGRRGDPDSEK